MLTMPDKINLFALVEDDDVPVRRIPLTPELVTQLQQFFTAQQNYFLADKQQIDFAGGYNTDGGELFTIKEYSLPDSISNALTNPLQVPILKLEAETHRIKALFSGVWTNGSKTVNFQVFDSSKLLKKGFTLIGSGDTYKKLEEPGLILQDKLAAHYADGTLYFSSYHVAKRFLDLDAYYREATDVDLEVFVTTPLFAFEDEASFKDNADSIIRTKVALLQKNKVLDELSVSDIQKIANNFNQDLPAEFHVNIKISEDGKLVVPKDKKQLKELIRFLDEDYVLAPLTKRKCLTNSKQYLNKA
jgi:Domain of unknown function (DUF4868)